MLINGRPAVGQPEVRRRVTAIFDELTILGVGDKTIADPVFVQQRIMTRRFVIEKEAVPGSADTVNATATR